MIARLLASLPWRKAARREAMRARLFEEMGRVARAHIAVAAAARFAQLEQRHRRG